MTGKIKLNAVKEIEKFIELEEENEVLEEINNEDIDNNSISQDESFELDDSIIKNNEDTIK